MAQIGEMPPDQIQPHSKWEWLRVLLLAYRITPSLWRHYEHNPVLVDEPKTTTTSEHIPGDPINIGLCGTQRDIVRAFLAADWAPADPITWRTSLAIAGSVLFRRADPTAPVSTLRLYNRRQDLAFEHAVGQKCPPAPSSAPLAVIPRWPRWSPHGAWCCDV